MICRDSDTTAPLGKGSVMCPSTNTIKTWLKSGTVPQAWVPISAQDFLLVFQVPGFDGDPRILGLGLRTG